MKLWKIFAVISTGLVLGLAYSYLSQEADLSANLHRHPSDGLPGTRHDVPQPILHTNQNIESQYASAQKAELTRNPPNEEVRMRVRFQKRAGPHKRPSDPLGRDNEEDDVKRPKGDVSKQKAVTWTDLLKEEASQRRLPEQTVQRHKRGADWTEQATRRQGSSGSDGEDAALSEEVAVEVAEDAKMAAEEADSALEGEEDGDLDEESGRGKGDELEESAEHEPARDKMARSSGRKGNLRKSDSVHLSAAGAEDDEDAGKDTAVEDASAGAEGDEDDQEEEDQLHLSQASVKGRGQADRQGSMGQPEQADSRVKGTLLQASNAAGKIKQQPKTQRAGAKTAGKTGRSRSAAVGKDVDKAAKNKTAIYRPALQGFNLTWEMLEGEEELYRQDVASHVALGAELQVQHDRPLVAQLTAALAKSRSRDGVVIVTWASAAYLDFLRNWVHHLTLLEVENFLIGAMDGIVADYLRQENIPYFDMQATMYSHMAGHLMKPTKEARMLAFNKIGVAQTLNTFGLNALLCDADVVWLRDPSDFFSGLEEADILVATDGLGVANAKDDDGLESPEAGLRSQMSTAILFLRHGRGSRNFLDAWDSSLRRNTTRTEQEAFNAVARTGVKPLKTHPDNWRVFYGMGRTVTFGILPASGFANGHSYFVQRLYEVMRVSPYAVHMSYVFGGVAAKRNRLREEQIWLDDPEYYDQKRLLTLDIHVPAIPDNFERLKNDYMVELHLKLMQHQLDQLVVGFAMAMTLNRTLVMPRLVCFCDRFWSPLERCRAPGAVRTQLPFVCPLDQILRPSHFGDDPSKYGPPIAFREHSFWDHPDTPAELKDNQVDVVAATAGESVSSVQKVGNQLVIPRDLSDADLLKTLEPYDDIKVLMVKNVTGIFRGFAEKSAADGFWRKMAHITGIWCCNYDGGIAYRMAPRLNSTISASL